MNPMDAFVLGVAILMVALFLYYDLNYRKPEIVQREVTEFIPAAAWLPAGIFFCLFQLVDFIVRQRERHRLWRRRVERSKVRRPAQHAERVIGESFELFGDRIAIIHAKDFVVEMGEIKCASAGLGKLRYDLVMEFAVKQKPGISIVLEDTNEETAQGSREFLRQVAEKWE